MHLPAIARAREGKDAIAGANRGTGAVPEGAQTLELMPREQLEADVVRDSSRELRLLPEEPVAVDVVGEHEPGRACGSGGGGRSGTWPAVEQHGGPTRHDRGEHERDKRESEDREADVDPAKAARQHRRRPERGVEQRRQRDHAGEPEPDRVTSSNEAEQYEEREREPLEPGDGRGAARQEINGPEGKRKKRRRAGLEMGGRPL